MFRRVVGMFILLVMLYVVSTSGKYRKKLINYPDNTNFWATDFFVRGCANFIEKCPGAYKAQTICARNYNGDFQTFSNYCEMQYENCNTWKNWHIYKRERC